jgi:hypothetical protein
LGDAEDCWQNQVHEQKPPRLLMLLRSSGYFGDIEKYTEMDRFSSRYDPESDSLAKK